MTLRKLAHSIAPRSRLQTAVVTAIVVGSLTAGVSYASIPDGNGVITGCYKPSNTVTPLKVIDTARRSECPNGYDSVTWNQTGAQGPAGPQGVQGPQGPQGSPGISGSYAITVQIPEDQGTSPETLTLPTGSYIVQQWGSDGVNCGSPTSTNGTIVDSFLYNYGEGTTFAQITGTTGQVAWSCNDSGGTFLAEARAVTT